MVELIQFFVLSSGCRANISIQMFQNEDPREVIRALTENFAEVGCLCGHWSVYCIFM